MHRDSLDYFTEIISVVGPFLVAVFALYIRDQLKAVQITQLKAQAALIEHQTKVRQDLQENQNEIRETIIKHVAEDAVQFRFIREMNQDVKETLRDIKDSLRDKKNC